MLLLIIFFWTFQKLKNWNLYELGFGAGSSWSLVPNSGSSSGIVFWKFKTNSPSNWEQEPEPAKNQNQNQTTLTMLGHWLCFQHH